MSARAPEPPADGRALETIVSCEHGGKDVPGRYRRFFEGHDALLQSHRGYDRGALELAREVSDALGAPLIASTVTRLLVDLNRSAASPGLFPELMRNAPREVRAEILDSHYHPYRETLEQQVDAWIGEGKRVFHLSSHSFTPVFDGQVRNADIGILYDPRRPREVALADRWLAALHAEAPQHRLRRNYPYTGRADGFCAALRRRLRGDDYIGLELEVNQRHAEAGGPAWTALRRAIATSLRRALR